MEGLFFYWIAWGAWVVVTFLMNKGKNRTQAAVFLLTMILFSNTYMTVGGLNINIALVIILIYGYLKLAGYGYSRLLYMVIVCHIIALAYIGFTMYSLYDPIVLWFDQTWMMAGLVFLLAQILVKPFSLRCLAMMIGIGHGNLLYAWMMSRFSLTVGSLTLFDLLSACFLMMAVWQGYGEFSQFMGRSFTRSMRQKEHTHTPVNSKKEPLSRTTEQ